MPLGTVPRIFCSSGVGGCVPICSGVHLGTQHSGGRDCEYSLCDWAFGLFHNLSLINYYFFLLFVFFALYCLGNPSYLHVFMGEGGSKQHISSVLQILDHAY